MSVNTDFGSETFNTDEYVKRLVKERIAGSELSENKRELLQEKESVSSELKKKIFENYKQFIETAREISHLESEMYQLSHILVDQRNLIEQIREETLLDDQKNVIVAQGDGETEDGQNKKAISIIKEHLIGYTKNLDDKFFIHEGSLIELNADDNRPVCRSHLFLFNDVLIIAKIKHDKKLEFMAEYETKRIALSNIRELTGVKNALRIYLSDGSSKIYQTVNTTAKAEWIEKFDAAVKFQQPPWEGIVSSAKKSTKKGPAPAPPKQLPKWSDSQSISSDIVSPIKSIKENEPPEWVTSAPEEIQAEIAQRHFEDSLMLIQKCENYIIKNANVSNSEEIKEKLKSLKTILASVMLHELSTTQCLDLQSVLRSSRRLLKLLVEMDKSREASSILLKVCTTAIRTAQRQARRNNLPVSELFFCDIAQVANEFLRAFQTQSACTSALIVWSNDELQYFSQQLIKHYLTKGTSLEVVAKVVENVRDPCSKLTKIGLDFSYYMEGLLRGTLENLIEDSRNRLIENISRSEEIWQPYNLVTKNNLRITLKELNNVGIDLKEHVTGDTWINLTKTTVFFITHFLKIVESCALIGKNSILKPDCESLLKDVFMTQHLTKPDATQNVDLNFVSKNKSYLVEVLLAVAIQDFEKLSGQKCHILSELQRQLLNKEPPKPKPRNLYKTDVI